MVKVMMIVFTKSGGNSFNGMRSGDGLFDSDGDMGGVKRDLGDIVVLPSRFGSNRPSPIAHIR